VLSLHVALRSRCGDVRQNFVFDFECHHAMVLVECRVPLHPCGGVVRENGIDEDSILPDQRWFGLVLQVAVNMLRGVTAGR
jgi:hypothetical protein